MRGAEIAEADEPTRLKIWQSARRRKIPRQIPRKIPRKIHEERNHQRARDEALFPRSWERSADGHLQCCQRLCCANSAKIFVNGHDCAMSVRAP
jgi:hypothetical protein